MSCVNPLSAFFSLSPPKIVELSLKTRKSMLSEGTSKGMLLGVFAFAECTPYRQTRPPWVSRQTQDVPSFVSLLYLFWKFETFEASHDLHVKRYAWFECAGGWAWCSYLCWTRFLLQQLLNLLHGGFTWESQVFWETSPEFHFILVWESCESCECRFLSESLAQ